MNWGELEKKCYQATSEAMNRLLAENSHEDFYAFSLYTDSSAMTVMLSANSEQQLESILENEEDKSKETINYYRWATSEWAYDGCFPELFGEISTLLRESPNRSDFTDFKRKLLQILTNTLNKIKSGELASSLEKSILFVSVTDDDESEEIENISAQIINNHQETSFFLERYT